MRLCVAAVAGAALLVGCTAGAVESPEPEDERTVVSASPSMSPSVSVSPSASPSPSPSPTTFESYPGELPTEDAESAAIIAGWQEYQRVYEKFAMAPNKYTDYTETQHVTTGHESTVILDRLDGLREQQLEYVSGRRFRAIEINRGPENSEKLQTSTVGYCLDMGEVKLRDARTGELIERSGTFREIAHMVRGRDGTWRVEGIESAEEKC